MVIIAIAVLAHLAFFVFFKTHYLQIFKTQLKIDEGKSSFPSLDRPFSLVPLRDQPDNKEITRTTQTMKEPQTEKFVLDELGKPSMELFPLKKTSSGGVGRTGPRRTTVQPKPLFIPWPKYPEEIKETVEGSVELLLYVDEEGKVEKVKIHRGLPHKVLNRVAVDAAWKIRFIPGREKGVPASMWVRLTIGFQQR